MSDTPPFIVHTIPGSPFARAVMAALEEKHASWQLARVKPGTLQSPEHLARHPFGRLPAVSHGDLQMYETQAIMRYIDRVIPEPRLTPADPVEALRMDMLMSINDWYMFQNNASVIAFQRVIGPALMGTNPDEEKIAEAMPRAHSAFAEISRFLGGYQWLAGDALSLADLHVGPMMDMLRRAPEWAALTADRPNLVAWLDRLDARPSMRTTTWEKVSAMARELEPA